MKKIFTIFAFMLVAFTIGCKDSNSKSNTNSDGQTTVIQAPTINENIQNTFFDTPFGASKEEVIKNFGKHGLIPKRKISNDNIMHFKHVNSDYFSFDNMSWSNMAVRLNNNKFYEISFYSAVKEKQSAISDYNRILSAISEKYKLTKEEPEDTTIYALSVGYGKNNSIIIVSCHKYESIDHGLWYTASLDYINDSISKEPSDEL